MIISNKDAFEVLLLQAAADGRGPVLFGDSLDRARRIVPAFVAVEEFPSVFLEYPLKGAPFLDVTLLYGTKAGIINIDSPLASGTEPMLDWFAEISKDYEDLFCGYELDTKDQKVGQAAVHFQPRDNTELVEPFCKALGEEDKSVLYHEMNRRLPSGWSLSFLGMFRGRPGAPFRVSGYLGRKECCRLAEEPDYIREVFDTVGFESYNTSMIKEISSLMGVSGNVADFQFDIYPDGSLSNVFAIDVGFELKRSGEVIESFRAGANKGLASLLAEWDIADERLAMGVEASFTKAVPAEKEDGSFGKYAFTLLPGWLKVRWIDGKLQPAKMYLNANAGLI